VAFRNDDVTLKHCAILPLRDRLGICKKTGLKIFVHLNRRPTNCGVVKSKVCCHSNIVKNQQTFGWAH